jgi:hypothetical protein
MGDYDKCCGESLAKSPAASNGNDRDWVENNLYNLGLWVSVRCQENTSTVTFTRTIVPSSKEEEKEMWSFSKKLYVSSRKDAYSWMKRHWEDILDEVLVSLNEEQRG